MEKDTLFLSRMDPEEQDQVSKPHDCLELMSQETAGLPTVSSVPIPNADFELFVDGSRHQDDQGRFCTRYAVVSEHEVVKAESMPAHMSAQEAELKALTEACKLAEGWPEAYPVAKATAKTTAKKLMAEIICRYGVPEVIESDRGSHFTGEIMSEVMAALGVSQALHTPYHPQSSGRVERLNGTLKLKI
ncbi:uncharacterized protein LOC143773771 [Ranitomeya variabilis]|uniref:uncharacterized protein LOC143773771 n=1 Tax=Ranitomeya variabilis TaxID=490064 RepID=UPI004055FD7D